jgi:hypothetical protein
MYINNDDLFNTKCQFCLYCKNHECLMPEWKIPSHNFCISFRYHSNLTKMSSDSTQHNDNKNISPHSTWGDILLSASEEDNVVSSHSLNAAVTKKAQFFYNIIPLSLFYCSECDLYFEQADVCLECESELNKITITLSDIKDFILNYIQNNRLLENKETSYVIKAIQYLELLDINIVEA